MPEKHTNAYIFKTVLLGDFAVGKTSLIQRFVHNKFSHDYKVTIGVNVMTKVVKVNNSHCTLSIFDLAGQRKFREIQRVFYVGTNAVIYVFDCTRPDTLKNLDKWQSSLIRGVKDDTNIIAILVGNKVDLKDKMAVTPQEAEKKAFSLNCCRSIQTSALTGEHVDEIFLHISERLIKEVTKLFTAR